MALRHFVATNKRSTPPQGIRKVAAGVPTGASGDFAEFPKGEGEGEGGARRPPSPRPSTGPTKTHRLGDRSQAQHPRSAGKLQHEGRERFEPPTFCFGVRRATVARYTLEEQGTGDKRPSPPATARQSSALPNHLI